jgi:hypothetical protein
METVSQFHRSFAAKAAAQDDLEIVEEPARSQRFNRFSK